MNRKKHFWRNLAILIVVVAAIGGAVYMGLPKGDSSDQESAKEDQSKKVESGIEPEKKSPSQPGKRDTGPQETFQAPDFTLKTLDGKTVTLSENDGKPSVINIWASWCPPCKVEMPYFQKAYDKHQDQVNFLMVNLTANDSIDKAKSYLEKENYTFPVLLDETGEVAMDYQAFAIPQTYVVNEKGEIIHRITGSITQTQLDEIMKDLTS
ncbi:TlpA family protein disulfide reductase [Kroppenstedtia pulmonis]|uniref:TlpA family protein disulfide reductase n=1 Tax=Kroppenstedtia pulmonis TaxID=1380685 RepID=A0A7D4C751_9BACL|nr:TlpA disulfide reductase family protein [Kroppenstedtia pulmonis]QKG84796.1 TlpA family protein disulfide reductase [Kroppenstedtia pulmonis]